MVLVYAETQNGEFKKAAFEALTYGYKTAQSLGQDCAAVVLGKANDLASLGQYGISKVYQVEDSALEQFDSQVYARAIQEVASQKGASVVVMSHSSTGKSLLGRVAVRLDAASISGASALPTVNGNALVVRKAVYSEKPTQMLL